ncbi:MAG: archaellin/type IV pilin N-terminal domain-containing protein [Candidatus Caldarchaeum sp.]|nr:archaellin/type IV pilin N-terminal domain-containing protein [Candidatus Caldarchaeum sp.]
MVSRRFLGLSGLVAAILLIAIVVAAAVVVSGVFFNLTGIAGRRPMTLIDQVKVVVNPATGDATWSFVIKNTGDVPIGKIAAEFPTGCSPGSPTYSGPILPGQTWGAFETASGCQVGETYTLILLIIYDDGSEQVLTTQVTATVA